jgi:cytochrome c peroxidase
MYYTLPKWGLIILCFLAPFAHAQSNGVLDLNTLETYADQPVPPYITKDNTPANNPLTDAGATLGRVLFYDKRLSVNNTVACANCHKQEHAFSDPAQASRGVNGTTGRHSMRLINTRFAAKQRFFWDERAASLEAQATMPIQDHAEMGFSGDNGDPALDSLLTKMADLEYYRDLFTFVYGDPEITEERMQLAIAQFIRSIQSFDSRFDAGLAATGDIGAPFANFSQAENDGKRFFVDPPAFDGNGNRTTGGFGCAGCHTPPEFDIKLHSGNNGFTQSLGGGRDFDNTRVSTLRDLVDGNGNVHSGLMHTGSFSTLRAAIDHYERIRIVEGNTRLDTALIVNGNGVHLEMGQRQRNNIAAFLGALTGTNVYTDGKWSDPFDQSGDLEVIPVTVATRIESAGGVGALIFELAQNYPNPFNPATTIAYRVAQASRVSLKIYNVIGQEVAAPINDFHQAGNYHFRFDGAGLSSGVYFYRLIADGQWVQTRRMLLNK